MPLKVTQANIRATPRPGLSNADGAKGARLNEVSAGLFSSMPPARTNSSRHSKLIRKPSTRAPECTPLTPRYRQAAAATAAHSHQGTATPVAWRISSAA